MPTRRQFLIASGGAIAAAASGVGAGAQQPSGRRVLHIIAYSHIDAAWLWPWRDGANLALTTFRSALDRMREHPAFCYSHSSAQHYRWVRQSDPTMFSEVQQRIREGRWEVVGGWPVEPDCNIPSTESFARQALYGAPYCRSELGVDVNIGFNPDSFGHAWGLPTILRSAGYRYYVFMRPNEKEMPGIPFLFWWQGPDGSRVLALRIWRSYSSPASDIPNQAGTVFAPGFNHAAFFLGVGDHGGGVTRRQIAEVVEMQHDQSLPELRFSTLRQFFAAIEAAPAVRDLPVVNTELQHHARGCYSAAGEVKALNRRAERWLAQAETISLAPAHTASHAYAASPYAEAWWNLAFNQFHDMLAGTALYHDYQDVLDAVGGACNTAQQQKVMALEAMARQVDLRNVPESAVFAFNPLPWPRKALLEFHTEQNPANDPEPISHLVAESGAPVPIQWRPADSMTQFWPRLSAWVELPACGYRVFNLAHGDPPGPAEFPERAVVNRSGFGLSSIKVDGGELLASAMSLVVIADKSDTWAHGVNSFRDELGRPTFESATVIENGAHTRVTRQRGRWRDSEIVIDVAEFAAIDVIELRFVIDWHEREQILKLEVPTALASPRICAKVPGAIMQRTANGEEEPYQDWVAVQGDLNGAQHTVALLNAQTYSYDCLGGLLRTVLVRSAPYARHNPAQVPANDNNAWQDQGRQERRFWIVAARAGAADINLDRRALELQTPAEYVIDSAHPGHLPREQSLFEVQPASVEVTALKRAEAGNGVIVRLQERAGKHTSARLRSPAFRIDAAVQLAPWQLKTLLLTPAGQVREVSIREQ